jgi:hypothetical protein
LNGPTVFAVIGVFWWISNFVVVLAKDTHNKDKHKLTKRFITPPEIF